VHISNLRQKVEIDPQRPDLVLTVRGIGYKFNDA
jgi:DNA-binding response OmpR family regulator